MIIRLIAETDAERKRFGGNEYVEHLNVKEYFLAGNKLDPEGSIVDYHEWNGGFRFLIGTLGYFYEVVNDDRRKAAKQGDSELPMNMGSRPNVMPKVMPMIRRGAGGNIQPLDISKLRSQVNKMPQDDPDPEAEEIMPVINPTEDEFIDEPTDATESTLRFFPGEELPPDEVDVVAEDISNQVQKEAEKLKNTKGLRIVPNKG